MREIADGVFEVPVLFVHAFLVVTDDGVVLVDTGLPRHSGYFQRALREAGKTIGDVRTILLTHWHADHTGNAADLQRRSGARVVAHTLDASLISGGRPIATNTLAKVMARVTGDLEPVPVDEELTADGAFSVPGFTAIHTPGHTPGHVSFLLDRAGGILFTGDAAAGRGGRVRPTPKMMTDDQAQARASVDRLARLDFDIAVFGHGPAVRGRAVEKFKELSAAGVTP
jgi:glyoxylase-like metal-dependent hydrolase (beta-lactamase superfamily II)